MKKIILLSIVMVALNIHLFAQEDYVPLSEENDKPKEEVNDTVREKAAISMLKKMNLTGFIQFQYEAGGKDAIMNVGSRINENPATSFNRIGVRIARLRYSFNDPLFGVVLQLDMTERGVSVRDVFLDLKQPWYPNIFLRNGLFFRRFGQEIALPSWLRETPERTLIINTLFPGMRDIGSMLHLQPNKTSPYHFLALEAALYGGNGMNPQVTSKKDFLGRFYATVDGDNFSWIAGVSHYNGTVFQGTENVYTMEGSNFVLNSNPSNLGGYAKRIYYGVDALASYKSSLGKTVVRAEYIWGNQPASEFNSVSPNSPTLPTTDTYIRPFDGGYVYLMHYIKSTPIMAVAKYDWYNPNTAVKGNQIGASGSGTTAADIGFRALGLGARWSFSKTIFLLAYYEMRSNETTTQIPRFNGDLKDNIFTLRVQARY